MLTRYLTGNYFVHRFEKVDKVNKQKDMFQKLSSHGVDKQLILLEIHPFEKNLENYYNCAFHNMKHCPINC